MTQARRRPSPMSARQPPPFLIFAAALRLGSVKTLTPVDEGGTGEVSALFAFDDEM